MPTMTFPDPFYDEAKRAAEAIGLPIESFIMEAVELQMRDELDRPLTPDQITRIQESRRQIRDGEWKSVEQVRQNLILNG